MAVIDHELFVRLSRSRDFLADSSDRQVRLTDAAATACISKYHYIRLFHQAFGQTPHEFLVRRRMDRARHLLATSDLSVSEVCLEVGYESLGTFSSRFRQLAGCAPTEFRKMVRPSFAVRWAGAHVYVPACFLQFYFPQFRRSN